MQKPPEEPTEQPEEQLAEQPEEKLDGRKPAWYEELDEINDLAHLFPSKEALDAYYASLATKIEAAEEKRERQRLEAAAHVPIIPASSLKQYITMSRIEELKRGITDEKEVARLAKDDRGKLFTDFCLAIIADPELDPFIVFMNTNNALMQILQYNPPPSPSLSAQPSPSSLSSPLALLSLAPPHRRAHDYRVTRRLYIYYSIWLWQMTMTRQP